MTDALWTPRRKDETYINPIIFADYSDPDVLRFGNYFYLTASSFQYTPGLPILRSANLVDWELITYALPAIPEERYALPQVSQGVWAPSIREYDGLVRIYYGMPDEGIYEVQAPHPEGPWSEPILIKAGKGLIDPCPYWDEEGNGWIVHAFAKSRIGFKSVLACFPFMEKGTYVKGTERLIFDGVATQHTIEGPKVHKKGDYYFIFAPAGSVKTGWQTVLRSRDIYGPYEERIVMEQGDSPINGPHQGAWIEDFAGQDWFVHFQDRGAYGRIVHLQPMHWDGDWPVIGDPRQKETAGVPVLHHSIPVAQVAQTEALSLQASDDFSSSSLGLQWQWYGNPPDNAYNISNGTLRLLAQNADGNSAYSLWHKPNLLTQKLIAPTYHITVELEVDELADGNTTGLAMLGDSYMAVAIRKEAGLRLMLVQASADEAEAIVEQSILDVDKLILQLWIEEEDGQPVVSFGYEIDGYKHRYAQRMRPSPNTWTGAKPTLFAISRADAVSGIAKFRGFQARRLP